VKKPKWDKWNDVKSKELRKEEKKELRTELNKKLNNGYRGPNKKKTDPG